MDRLTGVTPPGVRTAGIAAYVDAGAEAPLEPVGTSSETTDGVVMRTRIG